MTEVAEYQRQLGVCRELARARDASLDDALEGLKALWQRVPKDERFGLPTPLRALPA